MQAQTEPMQKITLSLRPLERAWMARETSVIPWSIDARAPRLGTRRSTKVAEMPDMVRSDTTARTSRSARRPTVAA